MSNRFPKSPNEITRGIVYFARMLDKIRLHESGELPADYHENLGDGFDKRCCDFLRVPYAAVVARVEEGFEDDAVLAWCFDNGIRPNEEQIEVWNDFMRKRGWNDVATERLAFRKKEAGIEDRDDIETMFDFIDVDEGRDPALRK
jgi:hypothetical protein